MFLLTCEMKHVIILRSQKNSIKMKTNSICFLPQLSSWSPTQKVELRIHPMCNPKETRLSKREWGMQVPRWTFVEVVRKNFLSLRSWVCHVKGLFSFFFLLINSESSAEISRVSANTNQFWWEVCQHLQGHTHFCQWEGATPPHTVRMEEFQIPRQEGEGTCGCTLIPSTAWKVSISGLCLFSESNLRSSSYFLAYWYIFQR